MLKGLGNIASLLKQAQTMGPKMQEVTEQLKARRVTGTAGAGLVTVHANGVGQILSIEIDPTLEEKNDFEMVKDLLPAAINQAIEKSRELHVEAMQSVTGGLTLPANMEKMLNGMLGGDEQVDPDDIPSP